ncbi:hypothetical protein DUI87_17459 [Hirundo rustica rustica]|uniref:Uncharacterized protein n=1 Tax=Hirundo rustica rustica TaxID=333673 RepID=A0A3M0K3V8_HIRRU|nr:hypothetical protein DUI87_17459 [Hirundo rustica rustica]
MIIPLELIRGTPWEGYALQKIQPVRPRVAVIHALPDMEKMMLLFSLGRGGWNYRSYVLRRSYKLQFTMSKLDLQSSRMEIKISVKHHYKSETEYSAFSCLAPKYPAWPNAITSLEDIFKGLGNGTGKWGQHSRSGLKSFFCCLYCVGNETMKLWHQAVLVIEAFLNGDDISLPAFLGRRKLVQASWDLLVLDTCELVPLKLSAIENHDRQ